MTAHALVEERQRCLEAGMNDHISKPIDPDALFTTLMRWTKSQGLSAEKPEGISVNASDGVILPEIEGVAVADGLKRLAGNRKLYRELLEQFAATQIGAGAEILSAITNRDRKRAELIAHTVKGVAGNIGLVRIFTAAAKLEQAICDADANLPTMLEEFNQLLERQALAIQGAMHKTARDRKEEDGNREIDKLAASAAVGHLRALLKASDGGAAEAFLSLRTALGGKCRSPLLSALDAAIHEFDFDDALLKLSELASEYDLEPTK
jgi:HPt (histidine-containing phosphotransfer) domain-containing protein